MKKKPKKTKQSLLYLLIWSPYNLQTYLNKKTVPCNSLRWSKRKKRWREFRIETNQSWNDKVSERSEVCLFSLQEALYFLLQCYWFVYKKSLTSFVLNKHVHWFIFLHFDPVQIISLFWALYRFVLHSFTGWVNGLKLSLSWLPHCYFE